MRKFLKEKLGLTDSGVSAVMKSSVLSFAVNAGYMAFMMIAMYFGNNILNGTDKAAWHYIFIIGMITAITYIIVDREYVNTYDATYAESAELRFEIADRIKQLPLSYFSKHNLSDLAQTIMQDVLDIEHAMSHAMPRCIGYSAFLCVTAILLFISKWELALSIVIPLLIGFLLMFVTKNSQTKWTGKYFWKTRENTETFQETIEMQREIKSYGLIEEYYIKTAKALGDLEKLRIKTELMQGMPLLLSVTFMKITLGAVALVSSVLLNANKVEIIFVIGFLLAGVRLVDSVGAIEESFAELFYLDARVNRINELRNTEIQRGKDVNLSNFDITLENIHFAYNDKTKVIDGISFVAKQNEVTAIVGPSGCGKSTLLRLISRLYDYDEGKIIIDGYNIKDISTESLFENISFVFQDVILFNASIMDNIRIGRLDATDEEVKEAAILANCHEFIEKMPDGYNTLIGENGGKLSGGERQRISIARAFLKNAPIILLDEISSSLDVENELKIQNSLNKLIAGKTVIIISHRLKSIEKADKIVVMNEGKIDNVGTHTELVKNSKLYRRLIEKSDLTETFIY